MFGSGKSAAPYSDKPLHKPMMTYMRHADSMCYIIFIEMTSTAFRKRNSQAHNIWYSDFG